MSRWRVYKRPFPPYWWVAMNGDNLELEHFGTHVEALDYADRMARTVEVCLLYTSDAADE